MGLKAVAVGTLHGKPRSWEGATVFDMNCPTKSVPPKGLPAPSSLTVTVFCKPKTWNTIQAAASTGGRIIAEGELCLDVPAKAVSGDVALTAFKVSLVPPKESVAEPARQEPPAPADAQPPAVSPPQVTVAPVAEGSASAHPLAPPGDGAVDLALESIHIPPAWLPIRLNPEKTDALRQFVQAHGHLDHPLTVRPLKKGRYMLTDGLRRYVVAKEFGFASAPAIIQR